MFRFDFLNLIRAVECCHICRFFTKKTFSTCATLNWEYRTVENTPLWKQFAGDQRRVPQAPEQSELQICYTSW